MNRRIAESQNRRIAASALALSVGLFLFAVYLFSYRGGFHSVDEVSTFAVTESLVKFGELNTDQIAWTQWTTTQTEAQGFFGQDGHVYSKKGFAVSLFQAPLYWLALQLPGLGMLQTVSLLNAILTAATGGLIFSIVYRLGYSARVSIFTALVFGLFTIVWVYAKYLFSGTLAGFLLIAMMYFLLVFKQQGGLWRLAAGGFLGGLTILARANNLLLPAIFGLYLLAHLWRQTFEAPLPQRIRRALAPLIIFAAGAAAAGAIFLWYNWARSGNPLQTGYDLTLFSSNILLGFYKLFFSPLRGLFIYSPILILAIPGWFKLRKQHPPEAWLIAALVSVTALLFSAWSSGEGLSWGSRFMVPVIPFLVIAIAPILDQLSIINYQLSISNYQLSIIKILFAALLTVSLFIQVIGVAINPWVYLGQLQGEFGGEFFLEKTAALYDFSTSQIVGQLRNWGVENSDIIWWQSSVFDGVTFGLSLGLALYTGWLLWQMIAGEQNRRIAESQNRRLLLGVGVLLTVGVSFFLLHRYYQTDAQFGEMNNPYIQALNGVAAEYDGRGTIINVAETEYHVAMNRFEAKIPLVGFARSVDPLADSAYPLLENITAAGADRVWLITARYAPGDPTVRVEAWLAQNAFKATDEWISDAGNMNVRLVSYGLSAPGHRSELEEMLGQSIQLTAVTRPKTAAPGSILPVIFEWHALETPENDYVVFLQLIDATGALAAQHDGPPQGGYYPAAQWPPGEVVADRHGLSLPAALSPGHYRLIAGLYNPADGQRLTVASGGDFVDLGIVEVAP